MLEAVKEKTYTYHSIYKRALHNLLFKDFHKQVMSSSVVVNTEVYAFPSLFKEILQYMV